MTLRGVCEPWPIDLDCCSLPDDVDPAVVERWQWFASRILWALSGRRIGPGCPITIRPCGKSCVDSYGPSWRPSPGWAGWPSSGGRFPYLDGGVWRNAVCGCASSCSCTELCELRLEGPVHDIVEVVVDGVVLPPEAYRVDAPNMLVRLDGDCWDACQDLNAPTTKPGTSAVTYRIGLPLDDAAIAAVSALTCHFVKSCTASCGCKVNKNVTRVERQGIEIETDPTLLYSDGLTGIQEVDLWIMAVNPRRLPAPARVYSPDFPRNRTMQWP